MNQSPFRKANSGSLYRSKTVMQGLALFAVVLICCGCGNTNRPKTVKVSGTITFEGGPPEYPGALFFAPIEAAEGYPRRGGRALFETDGSFAATSFTDGDGLVPGTYRVRLESWKEPPGMNSAGVSYIPKGYKAPELVVSEKERRLFFDLDVK